MLLPQFILKKLTRLKTFPFIIIQVYSKWLNTPKKVTKSNHKTSPVILFPKSPQSPDFTIKKGPENLRFPRARDGARRPGDVGFARTEAKRRHSNLRGTAVPQT